MSLGLKNWGLSSSSSLTSCFYVLLGGDCPGLLGVTGREGDVPGGFCPLTSMGYGCSLAPVTSMGYGCRSLAPERDSPDCHACEPCTSQWVSSGSTLASLAHCISWEGLVSPSLSMESLLRWAQLAGQLSRDLKDGYLLEGGL